MKKEVDFNKRRGAFAGHSSGSADNERITGSGAERKGWPRALWSGAGKNGAGVQRLVNHRLTHCLGGAVSRWVQSMHRFSN